MKFAMETAHEYTHVRQNANGDSARYLKNIAGENEEYAEFLAGFGKCVFEYFDGELQAMFVSSVIDEKDIPLIQKYNILCPKEKLVTKQMMFKKYGFKSEAEFKQFMNASFQNEFKKVAGAFMEHKDSLDDRTREYIERSGVFSKDNLGKLYADTKKYCKYQAIKEQEAYTTESMTAKSIMNTKRSINSDIYPLYYEMTAAAFN